MYDIVEKCRQILDIPDHIGITIDILHLVDENNEVIGEGYVSQNDDDSYDIVLHDELSDDLIKETIKHEMKHIQQMVQGRLLVDEVNEKMVWGYYWQGVFYKENDSYYDSPWEIEAREFENYLL